MTPDPGDIVLTQCGNVKNLEVDGSIWKALGDTGKIVHLAAGNGLAYPAHYLPELLTPTWLKKGKELWEVKALCGPSVIATSGEERVS